MNAEKAASDALAAADAVLESVKVVKEVEATRGLPAFLAHTKQKVINIVGLTALRLAFFMGYEF